MNQQEQFEHILQEYWMQGASGQNFTRTANSKFPYDFVLEEMFYAAWLNGQRRNQEFQVQAAAEFLVNVPKQIEKDTEIGTMANEYGTKFLVYWTGTELMNKPIAK
jgi:hypothetical protein